MRVALVHDWLTGMRGGEKCLKTFLTIYPDADIHTLVHVRGATDNEIDKRVKTSSWLSYIPGIRRYYRYALPLYPSAIASLDLKDYELVISLSHAAAKNVRVPNGVPHICFCFTPMRYIWDQSEAYFGALALPLAPIFALLRIWDRRGARRVTQFVAISKFVSARIRKFYRVRAKVIYPAVDTSWIERALPTEQEQSVLETLSEPAFLCAGALVPYKRIELAVKVFNRLGLPLWIVGEGPERAKLEAQASGNVRFFGRVSDGLMAAFYMRCRALVFPGIEDFGMVPIECMAAGKPVVAFDRGGVTETVRGVRVDESSTLADLRATGVFFNDRDGEEAGL